jgi:hypothetical protein
MTLKIMAQSPGIYAIRNTNLGAPYEIFCMASGLQERDGHIPTELSHDGPLIRGDRRARGRIAESNESNEFLAVGTE